MVDLLVIQGRTQKMYKDIFLLRHWHYQDPKTHWVKGLNPIELNRKVREQSKSCIKQGKNNVQTYRKNKRSNKR